MELVVDWIGAANAHSARGVSTKVARARHDPFFRLGGGREVVALDLIPPPRE
jgi:hypothetical protein